MTKISSQHWWLFESFRKAIRQPLFGITILTVSVFAMIAFGLLGIGRGGEAFADVRYWYVAAKAWLAGLNPYDHNVFQTLATESGLGDLMPFAYPPQSFAIGIYLAAFPFKISQLVWTITNVIAVILLSFFGVQLLKSRETNTEVECSRLARWIIPAIIIGNPFTAHVLWTGQTAMVICVVLIGSWQLAYNGKPLLSGVLLGFASIKPQLSVLVILWLFLEGHWRTLLTAGISMLAFSAVPILVVSPSKILSEWGNAMKAYQLDPAIASGLSYNTNLKSLLNGLGLNLPPLSLLFFMLVAIVITFVIWKMWRGGKLHRNDILGILLGLSLLLFFGRDYDIVVLVPILSAMWWHVRNHPGSQLASLALMTTLFIPHRIMEKIEVPFLLYWRIVILMIFVLWLFYCSFNERHNDERQPT